MTTYRDATAHLKTKTNPRRKREERKGGRTEGSVLKGKGEKEKEKDGMKNGKTEESMRRV